MDCHALPNELIPDSYYAKGDCINGENTELIKKLESKNPKTLILTKDKEGNLIYAMYSPIISLDITKFPFYEKNKGQIIYIYMVLSIDNIGVYDVNEAGIVGVKYFINGIIAPENRVYLSKGDHLLCLEINADEYETGGVILNENGDIFKYVQKTINFFTKGLNSYVNAIDKVCGLDNFLSSDYCKEKLKNDTIMNEIIKKKCTLEDGAFSEESYNKCLEIINLSLNLDSKINSSLSKDINTYVNDWILAKLSASELSSLTSKDISIVNHFIDILKKQNGGLNVILTEKVQNDLAEYCSKKYGDVFSIENDDTTCGKIYNDEIVLNYLGKSGPIYKSKQDMKYSYCSNGGINGKIRYEHDKKCLDEMKENDFMENTIENRCSGASMYLDTYCWGRMTIENYILIIVLFIAILFILKYTVLSNNRRKQKIQ